MQCFQYCACSVMVLFHAPFQSILCTNFYWAGPILRKFPKREISSTCKGEVAEGRRVIFNNSGCCKLINSKLISEFTLN